MGAKSLSSYRHALSVVCLCLSLGVRPALAQTATVTGRITDAATGAPLGATVSPPRDPASAVLRDSSGFFISSASADATGTYNFSGLTPGTYYLHTQNYRGYVDKTSDGINCISLCDPTRPIVLSAGTALTVNFALDASAVITGTIRDTVTRAPMTGATVSIYDVRQRVVASAVVDSTGTYRAGGGTGVGLAGSTYYAVAQADPGYIGQVYSGVRCALSCRLKDATPIRVGTAQTAGGIDFLLDRKGAITGRVGDVATSAPMPGVTVFAQDLARNVSAYATTGADGRFTITNLPPGTWRVFTHEVPAGYVPQAFDEVATPHCAKFLRFDACVADVRLATPVTVTAGATIGGVDLKLRRGGSIAGKLTRAGQPLSGSVTVYDAAGVAVQSVSSGSGGDYVADGVPAGTYFVSGGVLTSDGAGRLYAAMPCDGFNGCAPTTGTPVVVPDGARTNGIDIDLPASGTIAGTVRSASGALLTATLRLYAGDRRVAQADATNGAYSMPNLAPAAYQLRASSPGFIDEWYGNVCAPCGDRGVPVVVPAGASATGIDFQLDPAGKIAGVITLDSSVRRSSGVFVEAIRGDGTVVASTYPGQNGQYTLNGLPAGSYYVRGGSRVQDPIPFTRAFTPSGGEFSWKLYKDVDCEGADCPLTSATAVAVNAGATTSGIDMTLNAGGVIEGQLMTEGGAIAPSFTGGPSTPLVVQYPTVEAFTADGRRVGNLPDRSVASSPGKGHYNITGLRPGRYFLKASGGSGYASVIYRDLICPACAPSQGTPVTLSGPETRSGIDFTLLPGGSITGIARDDAGAAPISGVTVSAFTESGSVAATALTNASGSYVLEGLGAGRYFLATSNTIGYADEVYDNVACGSCDPLRGRAVDVQGGATTAAIDFGLSRGALIAGKVTDGRGASGGAATVSIFNSAGTLVARTQASDLGIYAVPVPAGTSFARLEPRANLAAILYDGKTCPGGTCDPTTGTPITSVAGQTLRGIDFRAPVCAAVAITPASLPAASAGTAYSATLRTSPGGPFTYTRQSGTLPPGISLAGDGTMSGTPTERGRYAFSVGTADAAGCGGSRAFAMDVTGCTPALPVSNRASQTFDVPGGANVVQVYLDSACSTPVAFNAPWLRKNRDFGPTVLEIAVSANPGGRRTGTVTIAGYTVTINQNGATPSVPFGSFDSPPDGNVAAGSVAVTGWVLDDLRVLAVHLYRSAGAGETVGDKFIGDATLVPGARPDVERLYPEYPYASRAGWGYLLLTNMLPNQGNGTFTVTAIAEDVEGNRITLGRRTIVANNATATKPFGAIDTPSQGETIGGPAYVNFGWALTPKPKTIPTNGSTITVLVDGSTVGMVTYNNPRSDIASLFPGLNNTNGPVGYRVLNTTTLLDGLHTIAWVVTDDAGSVEGVGSRYFTVANGSSQLPSAIVTPPALTAAPARASALQVTARELEPIEIDLGDSEPASCRTVFSGIERVGAAQRPLPIGSSLDRERGGFHWQPGPGFVGTYNLSFDVGRCDGSVTRIDVTITINSPHP